MTYARTFGLRYFGTVLAGPNAGRQLNAHRFELIDIRDEGSAGEAAAVARAQADLAGKFRGRIEVYARQWQGGKNGAFVFETLRTLEG